MNFAPNSRRFNQLRAALKAEILTWRHPPVLSGIRIPPKMISGERTNYPGL